MEKRGLHRREVSFSGARSQSTLSQDPYSNDAGNGGEFAIAKPNRNTNELQDISLSVVSQPRHPGPCAIAARDDE